MGYVHSGYAHKVGYLKSEDRSSGEAALMLQLLEHMCLE